MPGILNNGRHITRCFIYLVVCLFACSEDGNKEVTNNDSLAKAGGVDSNVITVPHPGGDTVYSKKHTPGAILQKPQALVEPEELMHFAESLIGIPYQYASSDPAVGFDCSGFITYVFTHFNITVPRSSIGFTDLGLAITEDNATRGDVILFTGTNADETFVGHMGLVTSHDAEGIHFIHSTSGKANAVTITPLNDYYRGRLVGFRRIL